METPIYVPEDQIDKSKPYAMLKAYTKETKRRKEIATGYEKLFMELTFGYTENKDYKVFNEYYKKYKTQLTDEGKVFKIKKGTFRKIANSLISRFIRNLDNTHFDLLMEILNDSDIDRNEGIEFILRLFISTHIKDLYNQLDVEKNMYLDWGFNFFVDQYRLHKFKFKKEFMTTLLKSYTNYFQGENESRYDDEENLTLLLARYICFFKNNGMLDDTEINKIYLDDVCKCENLKKLTKAVLDFEFQNV